MKAFEDKVNFIKQKFPDYQEINPYMNTRRVDEIKCALKDAGFVKSDTRFMADSAVINLIKSAQNAKSKVHYVNAYGRAYLRKKKKTG